MHACARSDSDRCCRKHRGSRTASALVLGNRCSDDLGDRLRRRRTHRPVERKTNGRNKLPLDRVPSLTKAPLSVGVNAAAQLYQSRRSFLA